MTEIEALEKQYKELEVRWDQLDAKPFSGSQAKQDEISIKMGLIQNELANLKALANRPKLKIEINHGR